MVKLIIAGGRNLQVGMGMINTWVWLVENKLDKAVSTLVCGMAAGIDSCGLAWAMNKNIPVERYPADWDKYGRAAGSIRNKQMAEVADALLLFWDGKSRGSANMLKEAEAAGLHVTQVVMEGNNVGR